MSDEHRPQLETSEKEDNTSDDQKHTTKVVRKNNARTADNHMTPIGDGGRALVKTSVLKTINWKCYKSATRKLLTEVFGRELRAESSLSGKRSPAFQDKHPKKPLDPELVKAIIQTVCERCNVTENLIRSSITSKCADEAKMARTRQKKQAASKSSSSACCVKSQL